MAAHDIPYVATATIGFPEDYAKKLKKAMAIRDGMSYIHLFTPCPTGWRAGTDSGIDICRLAVETNSFPLWEYERGVYQFTNNVRNEKPVSEYLRLMRKYNHLQEVDIDEIQQQVYERFAVVQALTEMKKVKKSDVPCRD